MTHDELLKTIDAHIAIGYAASGFSEYAAEGTLCEKALRAVVELHKPEMFPTGAYPYSSSEQYESEQCSACRVDWHLCLTIQAIEKELKNDN